MTEATLRIKVDSTDVVRASKSLKDLSDSGGKAEKSTHAMTSATETLTRAARTAAGALGLGLSAKAVIDYADAWQRTSNQLALVTDSAKELSTVQDSLLGIANDTRSSVESTIELYTVLSRSTDELNLSQGTLADLTKTINQSFAITGGSAAGAEGAIRQLSQALASGALRGDEFNSVNEQAPRLMDAVAQSLNMTKGELRDYAATGQITSQVIVKALTESADAIDKEYSTAVATFGQSVQVARNNLMAFIGGSDAVSTSVANLGKTVIYLSELLPRVGFESASTVQVMRNAWSPWGNDMRILLVSLDMHFDALFSNVGAQGVGTAEAIQLAFGSTLTNIRSLIQIVTIETASISDKFRALLRDQKLSAEEREANMAALDKARMDSINDVLDAHRLNTESLYDALIMAREARKEFSELDLATGSLTGNTAELTDANFAEWESMMNAKDAAERMNAELDGLLTTTEAIPEVVHDAKGAVDQLSEAVNYQANMVENVQREWANLIDTFIDGESDIGDFFDTFAKGIKRVIAEAAAADLASLVFGNGAGGNLAGLIGGGVGLLGGGGLLGSLLPGGNSMVAPGTAAKGLLGGLGSFATSPLGIGLLAAGAGQIIHSKTNDPDSFHRGMAGMLVAPTSGAPGGSQFSVSPFASGFTPTGFADGPASMQDAMSIIEQFRFLDETVTQAVRNAGGVLDLSRATLGGFGLDGFGAGTFMGRSQLTSDAQFSDQLDSYLGQLVRHIEGLSPDVMAELMGAGSAQEVVNTLTSLAESNAASVDTLLSNTAAVDSLNSAVTGAGQSIVSAGQAIDRSISGLSRSIDSLLNPSIVTASMGDAGTHFSNGSLVAGGMSFAERERQERVSRNLAQLANGYNPMTGAYRAIQTPTLAAPSQQISALGVTGLTVDQENRQLLHSMEKGITELARIWNKFDGDGLPEERS